MMKLCGISPVSRPLLMLALAIILPACSESRSKDTGTESVADGSKKEKKHKKDEQAQQQSQATAAADADDSACDPSLWQHVYDPSRLQVLDRCQVVSGTIQEVGPDDDGDVHMLLKLDSGQPNLTNKKNVKKRNGDLVIEVVCAHPPTLAAAVDACKGYRATIALPKNGAHVRVSGSYVIDTHNGWAELHPVSKIEPAT